MLEHHGSLQALCAAPPICVSPHPSSSLHPDLGSKPLNPAGHQGMHMVGTNACSNPLGNRMPKPPCYFTGLLWQARPVPLFAF